MNTVQTNDNTSHDSEVMVVPTMLLQPIALDKSTVKQILLDTECSAEAQMQ